MNILQQLFWDISFAQQLIILALGIIAALFIIPVILRRLQFDLNLLPINEMEMKGSSTPFLHPASCTVNGEICSISLEA